MRGRQTVPHIHIDTRRNDTKLRGTASGFDLSVRWDLWDAWNPGKGSVNPELPALMTMPLRQARLNRAEEFAT